MSGKNIRISSTSGILGRAIVAMLGLDRMLGPRVKNYFHGRGVGPKHPLYVPPRQRASKETQAAIMARAQAKRERKLARIHEIHGVSGARL